MMTHFRFVLLAVNCLLFPYSFLFCYVSMCHTLFVQIRNAILVQSFRVLPEQYRVAIAGFNQICTLVYAELQMMPNYFICLDLSALATQYIVNMNIGFGGGGDFSKGGRAHVELWKTEGVENRSRSIFCSQYVVFNPIRRKPWNDQPDGDTCFRSNLYLALPLHRSLRLT